MEKLIVNGDKAREKLLKGVKTLAEAVGCTLGPKGRNVVVDRIYETPLITNDGVTIAKEIFLSDEIEDAGAQLLKNACTKTNDIAGDGTTTATILAETIFSEGIKCLSKDANPVLLRNGIKKATNFVVCELEKNKRLVDDNLSIENVATISSGSKSMGELIARAYEKIGKNGVVTIDDGNSVVTSLNIVEGLRINRGYVSPYMCENQNKLVAELDNPYIFITDKKITNITEILPIIEKVAGVNGSLLIIAEDVEGDALTTLVVNNMRKIFRCVAVKTPYFGDRRKRVLDDIAISVGGKYFSGDVTTNFADVSIDDLGRCEKVKADKDNTTLIGVKGNTSEIEKRVAELKEELASEFIEYNRSCLMQRLSLLSGGVAVIKVGALSEVEMRENKLRMEDAVNATRAAIDEGIVIGGGSALLHVKPKLVDYIETLSTDEKLGAEILLKAIEAPIRQISKNAGVNDNEIVENVLSNENQNFGYDAMQNRYVDMFEHGIIDPFKVTRIALECASSVASTLLTTECVVVMPKELKERQEK